MGFGIWALQGCNCGCPVQPCALKPGQDYVMATSLAGEMTLFPSNNTQCEWLINPFAADGATWEFIIRAGSTSCTFAVVSRSTGGPLQADLWESVEDCSGVFKTGSLILTSSDCDPLNVVWTDPGGNTWTLTAPPEGMMRRAPRRAKPPGKGCCGGSGYPEE